MPLKLNSSHWFCFHLVRSGPLRKVSNQRPLTKTIFSGFCCWDRANALESKRTERSLPAAPECPEANDSHLFSQAVGPRWLLNQRPAVLFGVTSSGAGSPPSAVQRKPVPPPALQRSARAPPSSFSSLAGSALQTQLGGRRSGAPPSPSGGAGSDSRNALCVVSLETFCSHFVPRRK